MVIPNIEIIFISQRFDSFKVMMSSHPDDDFKLVETLRNKNDFNIRYYHCFVCHYSWLSGISRLLPH